MRRPLRLSRKVYRSCLLAALSAALICIGIFAGFAYNQVCLENARNLREEAARLWSCLGWHTWKSCLRRMAAG